MKRVLTLLSATLLSAFVFFHFGLLDGWVQSVTAILIVFVISFLFTTVAANAIAIVGTNPVSGMTLMTLFLSSPPRQPRRGLHGLVDGRRLHHRPEDRLLARHDAPQAGDLEVPRHVRCGGDRRGRDDHPQQDLRLRRRGGAGRSAGQCDGRRVPAAVARRPAPWILYFCGAALALVLTSIGVPALAFALGMFIPMELNAPLVVGGLVAWLVSTRSKDERLNKARLDRGTLIASGFIAGGALMGVVSAVLKFAGVDWYLSGWAASNAAEWTGLAMYVALACYFAWHTLRAKAEE